MKMNTHHQSIHHQGVKGVTFFYHLILDLIIRHQFKSPSFITKSKSGFWSLFDYSCFSVDTCGPPQIQNTMMNQTKYPGEPAYFKCQVKIVISFWKIFLDDGFFPLQIDMSKCMVAFIDWYYLRINSSEREKIKVQCNKRGNNLLSIIQTPAACLEDHYRLNG